MAALRQASDSGVFHQQGVALLVALLMLIAVLLMGASAARMAVQGEKAARADRDRYVAIQSAEDALHDAEKELSGGGNSPERQALLAGGAGFVRGCGGEASGLGLCAQAGADEPPVWQTVDIGDDGPGSRSVPYGRYTGAEMETGQGFLPFRHPRYVIERVPYRPPGADAAGPPQYFYRVTAVGFGARESTEVVLQSSYRKDEGGEP
ncbi:pilus assembly PilX family protein [Pseudoduganella namucuonensis]|uniref:Type IV pilus assembly protein PilX n=1 Tax=Pseudoduganella namucuonensis TaxID=1035707 RepID=A0A1I7KVT2_9BURK|nr:PilX N-terminal domain-containing pilus assembly protein [Pseudoduganella namucuonensis]SFV01550.1 type IV pilus assembly protein PilX [Pseudoduganella namucuonensis]